MDETPPLRPIEKYGVIETDTLCTGCHYNLHGQKIEIDDRLNMPVVRCPECGRFHPAGTGLTASSHWVRRFTALLMFAWVVTVLGVLLAIGGVAAGFDAASVAPYVHGEFVENTPPQTALNGSVIHNYNNGHFVYRMYPWNTVDPKDGRYPPLWVMLFISGVSVTVGLVVGTLCVTLMWHWRRPLYLIVCVLPAIPAAFIASTMLTDREYENLTGRVIERIACQGGFQVVGALVGIVVGRTISRTIIRAIIPPKPRKSLAFLWQIDGKTVPTA